MSKWVQLFSCSVILLSNLPLQGDDGYYQKGTSPTPEVSNFPLNPDQGWYTKESYLIWKPYMDDIDYATKTHTTGSVDAGTLDLSVRLEKPDFDWYSGVRLAVGRYLPNHSNWDIALTTTYFYANETDSSNVSTDQGNILGPVWLGFNGFSIGASEASVQWLLNYFTWDLTAGREFQFLRTVVAHPYVGLRAALIYQDYKIDYFYTGRAFIPGLETTAAPNAKPGNGTVQLNGKSSAEESYWGIGPRAGVDLQFNFGGGWLLLGGFSGSLFYGNYSVREKENIDLAFTRIVTTTSSDDSKSKDRSYCVRANVEGLLGIGWEAWVRKQTVRIAPSIVFEASQWFDANQFFAVDTSGEDDFGLVTLPTMYRHYGDLGLVGFSFNIQVDF